MKKILNTPFWLVCLVFVGLINSCKESKKDAVAEAETVAEVTPENALKSYLENGDETFSWVLKDSFNLQGVKAYDLLLTSQKWREHTWKHQLTVFVPMKSQQFMLLLCSGKTVTIRYTIMLVRSTDELGTKHR